MDFMQDYWTYHSCYEIPRNYALWAGIGLIGATVHRKVIYLHGDIEIHGTIYIGLIGAQGSSKSTCCSFAKRFFIEANPDAKIGPSRASPEILVKLLAEDGFARTFTDHQNDQVEVRPYAFFINEFKNFVGRSPFDMITFLTDIYDEKVYDASTIVRGQELIINPAINILMCETPEWFIRNIKGDIITGGITRRFILVYEYYSNEAKPNIVITPEAHAAKARFIQRLKDVKQVKGEFKMGDAQSHYEAWYRDNFRRRNAETIPMMQGFLKSKNVQLYKVMMLLDAVSDKPQMVFTKDLFELALSLIDATEKNLPKLSMSSGRNEMVASYNQAIEILELHDGMLPEKNLKRELQMNLNPTEIFSALRYMEETDQIIKKLLRMKNSDGVLVDRWMIMLPSRWKKGIATGEFVEQKL